MDKMTRWVERKGRTITFGNIVGAFVGREYRCTCETEGQAQDFEIYLGKRDPKNPNMPIAVTDEARVRFGVQKET